MINIQFIEHYIIPSIYAFFTIAIFIVTLLILNRFKQLSTYQRRIIKTLYPKIHEEKLTFVNYLKHFINQFIETVNKLLKQIDFIGGIKTKKLSQQLSQAGWRKKQAYTVFVLAKVTSILFFIILFGEFFFHILSFTVNFKSIFIFTSIGYLIGNYLPNVYLKNAIKTYRTNIKKALPDALELMVLCFEAGYSNEKSLDKIANDFSDYYPELSQEFLLTASELRVLPDRKIAWRNFAERTELTEINSIVIALQQNERYGTPLSQAIKCQIDLFRKNRMLKAEQKAARIPVLLSIPLILFFVPVLFVIILAPAVIRILHLFNI